MSKQYAIVRAGRGEGGGYRDNQIVEWEGHCTGLVTVTALEDMGRRSREDVMSNTCFDRHFVVLAEGVL